MKPSSSRDGSADPLAAAPQLAPTQVLTRGDLLVRNVGWNLLGQGAPLIVAVFAIPILVRALGTDRFGILALAWVVVGYFSLFDLGLSRALTQVVAERIGTGRHKDVDSVVWTSLLLMFGLGLAGALIIAPFVPWLVYYALKMPQSLQAETLPACYLLVLSIPIVITSTGLRGLLEALQRFSLSNAVRLWIGISSFVGPLLALLFSRSLVAVVFTLVLGRAAGWLAYFILCLRVMPSLGRGITFNRQDAVPLLRFGGWMTVSNIVGPLMLYLDRFLIGVMISAAAVAYYATPYEVVTKLLVIPAALAGVLFPAFATTFARDASRAVMLFQRGVKYTFLVLFPPTLLMVSLASEGLSVWLGRDFAVHSTSVLQWLAVGVLVNSLAQVAFALLQGAGRPDLTARLHLIELPFYLVLLFWLLSRLSIEGAAIAWTIRALVDLLLMFLMASRVAPAIADLRRMAAVLAGALALLALSTLPLPLDGKIAFLVVVLPGLAVVAWYRVLSPEERALGRGRFVGTA